MSASVPPSVEPQGDTRVAAPTSRGSQRRLMAKLLGQRKASVFLMLLIVATYLSISSPYFLEARNLLNVGRQFSVVGIVATGEALVIIAGAIDLSVGSTVGFPRSPPLLPPKRLAVLPLV